MRYTTLITTMTVLCAMALGGCEATAPTVGTATVEIPVQQGEIGPSLVRLPTPPSTDTTVQHGHRMVAYDDWYIIWADLEPGDNYKLSCEPAPFALAEGEVRRTSC